MDNKLKVLLGGIAALLVAFAALLANYIADGTVDPAPSPSVTATAAPSALPSPVASVTPSPTASPKPSSTPSPVVSATPSPTASPKPSSTPSPVASATPSPSPTATSTATPTALVIDGFERPEYAPTTSWKSSVSRTILKGAVTGFVVAPTNPCAFTVSPAATAIYKMYATVTTTPSSSAVKAGTYYDALPPLNGTNCSTAKYIWVDVAPSVATTYNMGGATVAVFVKGTLPTTPVKPMMMLMGNSYLTSGHYGKYVNGSEALGDAYLKEMAAHRLHPYASRVVDPPALNGYLDLTAYDPYSFQKTVLNYSPNRVWLPNFSSTTTLQAAEASTKKYGWKSWFYTMDEPADSQITELKTMLASQKQYAPSVKRMVTLYYRSDLDIDIFTPVAEQFDLATPLWTGGPTYPGESTYSTAGKELWLYVSCMSHGCGGDGATVTPVSGSDTGAPDLTMDRGAAEPFGYMLLAQKYTSVKALLYYNTVEQYKLYPQGVDMWKNGVFNFGGNMDGTLFWPGRVGVEGITTEMPVVSVRMKLLREAQNLADLLSQMDQTWVKTKVSAIMTDPRKWNRKISDFEQLQKDAMALLP